MRRQIDSLFYCVENVTSQPSEKYGQQYGYYVLQGLHLLPEYVKRCHCLPTARSNFGVDG